MRYAERFHEQFPRLNPCIEDLFLLEAHQIAALPDRAPRRELAQVLHAHPLLVRFLGERCPSVRDFLDHLLANQAGTMSSDLSACEQAVVWELADWIVYQRAPEDYDTDAGVVFDLAAVTNVVALDGKVVLDAGAGTGRVALAAAPVARHVFAVEPVAALRRFMRDKATQTGINNLFVMDGYLHAIPLPARTVDVLITCQAIGWAMPEELQEIERVVKPGGFAQHLFGVPGIEKDASTLLAELTAHGYHHTVHQVDDAVMHTYWLRMPK